MPLQRAGSAFLVVQTDLARYLLMNRGTAQAMCRAPLGWTWNKDWRILLPATHHAMHVKLPSHARSRLENQTPHEEQAARNATMHQWSGASRKRVYRVLSRASDWPRATTRAFFSVAAGGWGLHLRNPRASCLVQRTSTKSPLSSSCATGSNRIGAPHDVPGLCSDQQQLGLYGLAALARMGIFRLTRESLAGRNLFFNPHPQHGTAAHWRCEPLAREARCGWPPFSHVSP